LAMMVEMATLIIVFPPRGTEQSPALLGLFLHNGENL
jgi:hypothetical protein